MTKLLDGMLSVFGTAVFAGMVVAFFIAVAAGIIRDPLNIAVGVALLITPPLVVAVLASPYYLGKYLLKRFR